ncbi:MAG: hypothetical protein WB764_25920 [Xanthobacteraceae bacterium]
MPREKALVESSQLCAKGQCRIKAVRPIDELPRPPTMSEITGQQREDTAYHEAGHAVMGYVLQRFPLLVTIIPDGTGAVGKTEFEKYAPPGGYRYFDDTAEKKRDIRSRVLIDVAGTIAHDLKFPERDHDEGDKHDDYWARDLVGGNVSWEDHEEYLERTRQDGVALLKQNWHLVDKVAAALLQHGKLMRADFLAVCGL